MLLTVLTFLFVFLTISLNVFLFLQARDVMTGKATDVGRMSFCINVYPAMDFNCSPNMTQNIPYTCIITGNDSDNDSFIFRSNFVTNRTVFNITAGGLISVTPGTDDVGNHTANISIDDLKCNDGGAGKLFNFTVENVNDKPVLRTPIPDQTLLEGIQLQAFFLNDYFYDPDGDALNYTKTLTSLFTVSISGDSMVLIIPLSCPAEEYIIFTATDPFNESADSNAVLLKCVLPSTTTPSGGTGDRGGGGGGGASTTCRSKMECLDWEECEKDNRQRRKCFDRMGCKEGILFMYRECEYIAQCHNGILDYNEEDVDCGGPCPACPTCTDGIRNGNEVNIDCGGSCQPCIVSKILFAEETNLIADLREESQGVLWNLSVWNAVAKYAEVLDTGIGKLPFGEFSYNGSLAYYVRDQDIWSAELEESTDGQDPIAQAAKNATNASRFNASLIRKNASSPLSQLIMDNSVYMLSTAKEGLYYSKTANTDNLTLSENAAVHTLMFYGFGEDQSQEITPPLPVFSLDSLANGRMIAFSTVNFTPDFSKKYYIKRLESYIFGNILLGERSKIIIVDHLGEVLYTFEDPDLGLYAPKFSPDGTLLVYFSYDGKQSDIWLASLNDSSRLKLTNSPNSNEIYPLFSRDNKHILYSANYNSIYALYSLELKTTGMMNISALNSSLVTKKILSSPNNLIGLDWYASPNCFDGLLNQDETGIDCGGSCGPCGSCQDSTKWTVTGNGNVHISFSSQGA